MKLKVTKFQKPTSYIGSTTSVLYPAIGGTINISAGLQATPPDVLDTRFITHDIATEGGCSSSLIFCDEVIHGMHAGCFVSSKVIDFKPFNFGLNTEATTRHEKFLDDGLGAYINSKLDTIDKPVEYYTQGNTYYLPLVTWGNEACIGVVGLGDHVVPVTEWRLGGANPWQQWRCYPLQMMVWRDNGVVIYSRMAVESSPSEPTARIDSMNQPTH
eukprot:5246332-Amphidinium_carterae.1